MANNWVKVFSSELAYLIEIARGLLEQNGIKSIVLNKKDSMHTHLYNNQIELYVSNDDVIQAKYYLSKMEF